MDGFCIDSITIHIATARARLSSLWLPQIYLFSHCALWPLPCSLAPLLVEWGIGRRQLIHISAASLAQGAKVQC